jgi:hypothetical protein
VVLYCARCGAELPAAFKGEWWETNPRCRACGVAVADPPGMLAPSDDEVAYDLMEWPPADRAITTAALVELDIPYRWDSDLVLVVPAATKGRVDPMLDAIAADAAEPGLEVDDLGADDGGQEAQSAMSDLFIAANGLQHAVWDEGRQAQFITAARMFAQHPLPPYGIEHPVWERFQTEAAGIVEALETDADDGVILNATRDLRNLLRSYV